jgi:hypothetical protein
MQDHDEKRTFLRIVKAAATNVVGFGLATALVSYLAGLAVAEKPVMILAGLIVLIMLISLSSLLLFIGLIIKNIPETMEKSAGKSFFEVYRYMLYALGVRCAEAIICIIYIVHIYHLYF